MSDNEELQRCISTLQSDKLSVEEIRSQTNWVNSLDDAAVISILPDEVFSLVLSHLGRQDDLSQKAAFDLACAVIDKCDSPSEIFLLFEVRMTQISDEMNSDLPPSLESVLRESNAMIKLAERGPSRALTQSLLRSLR